MKKFMGKTMAKMNENRRNGRKALKGFTLVEIIVVLVILAILAAAMIPALTGYIDKAKERTAIAEARNVLTAAQTLASEEYGMHGTTNLKDGANTEGGDTWLVHTNGKGTTVEKQILALADITSTNAAVTKITFIEDKAKIASLEYTTSNKTKVLYDGTEFKIGDDIPTE